MKQKDGAIEFGDNNSKDASPKIPHKKVRKGVQFPLIQSR
jgi:hypothetical protein